MYYTGKLYYDTKLIKIHSILLLKIKITVRIIHSQILT